MIFYLNSQCVLGNLPFWNSKLMECCSMVSVAAFGPGDHGSNPGWFAVLNSNLKLSLHKYKHSRKYHNPAMGASFKVLKNRYLRWSIDGLVHQYEEIWSRSTWQDQSRCSTGLLESSRLNPAPLTFTYTTFCLLCFVWSEIEFVFVISIFFFLPPKTTPPAVDMGRCLRWCLPKS